MTINLPPTAGGYIPHPPFSSPRFPQGEDTASLHNCPEASVSGLFFYVPVIGGGHGTSGEPATGDPQGSNRIIEPHETAAAIIPPATDRSRSDPVQSGGPSFSRAGRRDSGGGIRDGETAHVSPWDTTPEPAEEYRERADSSASLDCPSAAAKLPAPRCARCNRVMYGSYPVDPGPMPSGKKRICARCKHGRKIKRGR